MLIELAFDIIKTGIFTILLIIVGVVLDKTLLHKIDTIKEVLSGNKAVAIVYGSLFIALAILLNGRI